VLSPAKVCTKCKVELPLTRFYRSSLTSDGLRHRCAPCCTADNARWYKGHRAKIKAASTKWHKDHPEEVRARSARRRKDNPGAAKLANAKWRNGHRTKVTATNAKWKKDHAEAVAADSAKRRANKITATPAWADHNAIKLFYVEAAAKTAATGHPHHVDHIVPLRARFVCGLHTHQNLRVIPGRENGSKGNRFWPDMP